MLIKHGLKYENLCIMTDDINVDSVSVQIYGCIQLTYAWSVVVSRQHVYEVKFNK